MTPDERAARRAAWLTDVEAEIERRRNAALTAAGGDPREWLRQTLTAMADRLRAAPGYVAPTPARQRASTLVIEEWFREWS